MNSWTSLAGERRRSDRGRDPGRRRQASGIQIGPDGQSRQSERGELRHPFTGVALALECGVPDDVCHIIAAHPPKATRSKRTTEAYCRAPRRFMAYLPLKTKESEAQE